MGATATSSYRCCCDSDQPSFVLSMIANYAGGGVMPEFKLQQPVAGGVETTLCGYVVRNLEGHLLLGGLRISPVHLYRLVYRGKNGSGGALNLPPASVRPHNGKVIEGTVDAEREERRLMATEEGRQSYGFCLLK